MTSPSIMPTSPGGIPGPLPDVIAPPWPLGVGSELSRGACPLPPRGKCRSLPELLRAYRLMAPCPLRGHNKVSFHSVDKTVDALVAFASPEGKTPSPVLKMLWRENQFLTCKNNFMYDWGILAYRESKGKVMVWTGYGPTIGAACGFL